MMQGKAVRFPIGWFGRVVHAGPYRQFPGKPAFGVKLAEEINMPCSVSVPIRDFSVPKHQDLINGLMMTIEAMVFGQPIYVGCMGGKGRTGLFLACLAKALGIEKPVEWVREHYNPHAVETQEQYQWVANVDLQLIAPMVHVSEAAAKGLFWKL